MPVNTLHTVGGRHKVNSEENWFYFSAQLSLLLSLSFRGIRIGPKLDEIGPKWDQIGVTWDKSGTFPAQISVHFGSLKIWAKIFPDFSHLGTIWSHLGPIPTPLLSFDMPRDSVFRIWISTFEKQKCKTCHTRHANGICLLTVIFVIGSSCCNFSLNCLKAL